MQPMSLAESGFKRCPLRTRRQPFLAEMDAVVPGQRLVALVEPVQPKMGARGGQQPYSAKTMLRIHFMQQWFALSDPAMQEALHDMPAMRAFTRLDARCDCIPDESSILRVRHRLESNGVCECVLAKVNALLSKRGLLLKEGLHNLRRERIAALRGARFLASLMVISRSLRCARSRRSCRPSLRRMVGRTRSRAVSPGQKPRPH